MTVFPTAAHLVSWAKFAPIDRQSAGRAKTASTGKGNPWLAGTLGEIVAGPGPHRHLPRRPLPPPGPPPRQETGHRRGRQLGPHHHLAPAVRPGHPLPRPRPRLPRREDQPTTPPTRPDPPTRTPHRQESHPPTQARPTRHSLTRPTTHEPGSASLRRALPPAHSRTDFRVGHSGIRSLARKLSAEAAVIDEVLLDHRGWSALRHQVTVPAMPARPTATTSTKPTGPTAGRSAPAIPLYTPGTDHGNRCP